MFAVDGRDLLPMVRAREEAGLEIDEQDIEPDKTPFPGRAIESFIGFSCISPTETIEDYFMQLWASIRLGIGEGVAGPPHMTWTDVDAYQRVTGYILPMWVLRVLFMFERALAKYYKTSSKAVNNG